jgi:hypothetical protein
MADASEDARRAAERKDFDTLQRKIEHAKPTASMLQYLQATQVWEIGFTVTLLDGSSYTTERGDHIYTDGISIVHEGHRLFFPLTAIKSIRALNPGDPKK